MENKQNVIKACNLLTEEIYEMKGGELERLTDKELDEYLLDINFIESQVAVLPNGAPNRVDIYKHELKQKVLELHGQQYKDEDIGCTTDLSSILAML